MKPPAKVKVGHKWFRIVRDLDLAGAAGAVGVCGPDTQEVRYDGRLGAGTERETILHELLHGAWNMTTLDRIYDADMEENILYSLSPLIVGLLRDNPPLVRYLLEKL